MVREDESAGGQTISKMGRQKFSKPSAHSIGLDLPEADSIDSGYPALGKASPPRLGQNIQPTELVIERIKPIISTEVLGRRPGPRPFGNFFRHLL